jgi:uncharacterized membrane protein YkgB
MYLKIEKKISSYLKNRALTLLRYSMAIIYFWYGLLKVMGISPAEELVYRATHWLGSHHFVMVLGFWEMAIGLFLFVKRWNRWGLILLFLQFPGTFLPLFLTPEDCFTVFPYGLTLEGQYIFKNLILIAAGLLLVSSLHSKD